MFAAPTETSSLSSEDFVDALDYETESDKLFYSFSPEQLPNQAIASFFQSILDNG